MQRKMNAILSAILMLLGFGNSLFAQECPFGGTWKLDMESVAKQMPPISEKNAAQVEMIAMKTERLRSVRYILNNTSGVIVNEGIPNVVSWMTTRIDDASFELTNPDGIEKFTVEIKGRDRLVLTAIVAREGGEQKTTFDLLRVSDVSQWESPRPMEIGMNAPPISAQLWLRQPAREIELADGRVYLIEFWATWCAPCLQKMPKLVELQREFGLDQLAVVAVTTESREAVLTFVDRYRANKDTGKSSIGIDISQMANAIAIGVDDESSSFKSYMVASGFRAVPTRFIVGKTGQIEWAGVGDEYEDVLRKVLVGSWDRKKFAETFAGVQRAYLEYPRVQKLLSSGKPDDALALISELEVLADAQMKATLEMTRARLKNSPGAKEPSNKAVNPSRR